ncbi:MAG: MBL fold metallo-hydrolase [Ilumatobacteraceae bacterium]
MIADWADDELRLTDTVSVLLGAERGVYPSANSLFVRGAAEHVVIDASVTVVQRGGAPDRVDAVINSHCHEDHMAGNGMFAPAKVHVHERDLIGVASPRV